VSPIPRRPFLAVTGGALFAATAGLVAAGVLTRVDQHAVSHLMPWLRPRHHSFVSISSLTLPGLHGSPARCLVDLWTYPAALVPSAVLVLAAAGRLRTTGRMSAAITWCVLWVAGNAIELAGKLGLERPALYRHGVHVTGFDHSLPSGHTIRSLVVAGALAWAWRRGWVALLWAATVPFALVALGDHTPTDVVAGVFVVLLLAGWAPPRASRSGAQRRVATPRKG
jgi:membrane-associated phospholipid phosphatase